MMKKGSKVEWNTEYREFFSQIKKSIAEAPILTSLDYTLPFYIRSKIYAIVLDQAVKSLLIQSKLEESWKIDGHFARV